ncbi:MAG: sugar phosphate nucleotidyltransferase [Brevinema sp.]
MKAFIFAAGYGTRSLPASKTIPKELFPVYDKTAIDFILDECTEVGITELVILTSRRKKSLDDYFDREIELETALEKHNKAAELETIHKPTQFNVSFIRQKEMGGTGHALLTAAPLLKHEPFMAFFPDDIILGKKGGAAQILDTYNKTGCCVLAAREELENPSAYGVIESVEENGVAFVRRIVEKPKAGETDSNLVSIGRFIYTPEFLEVLAMDYKNHKGGEFYPMGAMMAMAQQKKLVVQKIEGMALDTGNNNSYLNTILEYAFTKPEGRKIIESFYARKFDK